MDAIVEMYRSWNEFLGPWPALRALETIVAFLILAWLVDRLTTGIVSRMAARTETTLDDRMLALIHTPIFVTVARASSIDIHLLRGSLQ